MAIQTTTFKGARYIVKFHDPIAWDSSETYEAIEAVQHNAFTYISKQPVPAGVQIDNEDFWLLWADPNAQMEQLRQLVSQYVDAVEDVKNIIPFSDFTSENTVKDYIDSKMESVDNCSIKGAYIGRICFFDTTENTTGACTLIDDDTLVFTGTNSTDTNQCDVYLIDLSTKTIINKYTRNFNHCNGMCFNRAANKIYVSPNFDYTSNSRLQTIYECNATTFNIENEYTFDFEPHGVAYDAITEKMYIIGTPEISIYEFNVATHQATLIKTVSIATLNNKNESFDNSLFGWQDSAAYNNDIYCLRSGEKGNCIVKISVDDDMYDFYYLDRNIAYFTDPEPEGIEIDSYGNAIICGRCVSFDGTWKMFAPIYKVPINTPVNTTDLTFTDKARIGDCNVNGSIDVNNSICPTGAADNPFTSFLEAVMAMPLFIHNNITITGNTVLKNLGNKKVYDNLNITVQGGKVLEFVAPVYFKDCRFTGQSTHGIFKRGANVATQAFNMFGACMIRQMDFDFDNAATAVSFAQTRQGIIIIMDSITKNNGANAPIARGENGSLLLAGQNVTGDFTNFTGTIYPN